MISSRSSMNDYFFDFNLGYLFLVKNSKQSNAGYFDTYFFNFQIASFLLEHANERSFFNLIT